jgi:hypothetical protein
MILVKTNHPYLRVECHTPALPATISAPTPVIGEVVPKTVAPPIEAAIASDLWPGVAEEPLCEVVELKEERVFA